MTDRLDLLRKVYLVITVDHAKQSLMARRRVRAGDFTPTHPLAVED